MDIQGSRPKRDRPFFVDLLIIGAAIAALMYGGLRLLARTHTAWEHRYGEKPTPAATSGWTIAQEAEYQRLRAEALERRLRYDSNQPATLPGPVPMRNRRCIDGILFAEVDGAITNVGRCRR